MLKEEIKNRIHHCEIDLEYVDSDLPMKHVFQGERMGLKTCLEIITELELMERRVNQDETG